MEGNLSSGNINLGGSSYGGLDLQSPMRPHPNHQHQQQQLFRQGSMVHQPIPGNFSLNTGGSVLCDLSMGGKGKSGTSEEEEPSFTEDTTEEGNKGKKGMQWHRVKWTDKMVKLMITAVSYVGEDTVDDNENGLRRCANVRKKGKWKSISKVMAERGHSVSPQQCEDKFNDLNKRYKRLNEILGRGTSCQVVEKPELLDMMHNLSEKAKEEVRKILSSKQLFYEEMCSYHNKNRLHLPHDMDLQRSLRVALRIREDQGHDDFIEDDHDAEGEDHDEFEEKNAKKMKSCLGHGNFSLGNSSGFQDFNKNLNCQPQNIPADTSRSFPEGGKDSVVGNQWIEHRSLQLEEKKLQIQAQMLELEREKLKWQGFCRKEDQELEIMRTENEKMKLENERMALELKKKELGIDKH